MIENPIKWTHRNAGKKLSHWTLGGALTAKANWLSAEEDEIEPPISLCFSSWTTKEKTRLSELQEMQAKSYQVEPWKEL